MKCVIHQGKGFDGLKVSELETPAPGPGEVLVKLKAAALNHRDIWVAQGRKPEQTAVILGSDGAGVVERLGDGVAGVEAGQEVVINPSLGWPCNTAAPPGPGYEGLILGYPTHGTFAEYVVVPDANVEPRPPHLSWEDAAALPLVGLTTYRALFTKGGLKAGETVVVPGIGAGTAIQALLFAKKAGARVVVTSRSEEKLNKAKALGADLALPSDRAWAAEVRALTGGAGADLVIESVGQATWGESVACLRLGGRLVVFGSTSGGDVPVNLPTIFLKWISIIGTTMGSREEFKEMLRYTNAHEVVPVVDRVFPLDEALEAFKYLDEAKQFGKVVLSIAD